MKKQSNREPTLEELENWNSIKKDTILIDSLGNVWNLKFQKDSIKKDEGEQHQ